MPRPAARSTDRLAPVRAAPRQRTTRSRGGAANDARPRTLAVDIGGTFVKASVLDRAGTMLSERVQVETPDPATPRRLLDVVAGLARQLPAYERIAVGFPGIVHHGRVYTAPNLGNEAFYRYDLAGALKRRLGKPARVLNDADIQGLGVIRGRGVEVVITLGTGFGSALFLDGEIGPHIQLAPHPDHGRRRFDELGADALERLGAERWSRRIAAAIQLLRDLTSFDHLYVGGGNAAHLRLRLPADVTVVDNHAGILGGIRVWERVRGDGGPERRVRDSARGTPRTANTKA